MTNIKDIVKEGLFKKPLYMRRNLISTSPFIAWAKTNGISRVVTASEIHTTLAYSTTPVDFDAIKVDPFNFVANKFIYERKVVPLGDKGAIVLMFEEPAFRARWLELREVYGASWDFPDYHSHVTITYEDTEVDIDAIVPYDGSLIFGPEIKEEIQEDFAGEVVHEKSI